VRRLRVRRLARAEIDAVFSWYLERSPTAAGHFLDAVDDAMQRIEEHPERYRIIHGRLRRVLLEGFPYSVFYKVYPSVISVVGVIHGSRHPDAWLTR
jgi:plasmid stabilization system protein ParE